MADNQTETYSSSSVSPCSTPPSSGELELRDVHASFSSPLTFAPQDNWSTGVGLFHAALAGDSEWVRKNILNRKPQHRSTILNSSISTSTKETALHIAAGANQAEFVDLLLRDGNVDLTSKDINSNTAFCSAVVAGAQKIVDKFLSLPTSLDLVRTRGGNKNLTPLYMAASFGHGKIASQLYDASKDKIDLEAGERYGIFLNCIKNDLYDLAIRIFINEEKVEPGRLGLVQSRDRNGETALHVLCRKFPLVSATDQNRRNKSLISLRFSSQLPKDHQALTLGKMIWKRLLEQNQYNYFAVRNIINTPFNLVMEAAMIGNFDFLVMLLSYYPELIWEKDDSNKTIFHYAIMNRHVKIFNLIHEIGLPKSLIQNYEDDHGNNMLHLAARKPPKSRVDDVSGAALQMQREILWFKEVEKIVAPSLKSKRNHDQKTAQEVFSQEHMDLVNVGEKWMKENAKICLIVATIIVTAIFQTSFSVPNSDVTKKDSISQIHQPSEKILKMLSAFLTISRTLAMSSSITAIILFLSILISRFTEKEFFKSLLCTFIGGLVSLFISVIFMMVSFFITSFMFDGSLGIPIFTSSFQFVPIILFVYLIYPVFRDVACSTFFSKFDFNAEKRVLHFCESGTERSV